MTAMIVFAIIAGIWIFWGILIKTTEQNKINHETVATIFRHSGFKTSKEIRFAPVPRGLKETDVLTRILFCIDLEQRKLAVCDYKKVTVTFIDFDSILSCEILEDNSTIMRSGIGGAIVGGILAGGVGAIVGSNAAGSSNITQSMIIRIISKDIQNPLFMITVIDSEVKRDEWEYKAAFPFVQEVFATISIIIDANKTAKV